MSEHDTTTPITFAVHRGGELIETKTISREIIKIGRLQTSNLHLDDDDVSRMHAVIEVTTPGEVYVIDLGSSSGTLVNGEKVNKHRLQDGDALQIGGFELTLNIGDVEAVEAVAAPVSDRAEAPTEKLPAVELSSPAAARAPSDPPEESAGKFNPFAVGAKRGGTAASPFALQGADGDDGDYYGIVPTADPVPSHEVETSDRAAEVAILWGDRSVLRVDHLTPPRDYYVGESNGEAVDFIIGEDGLGKSRMPICLAEGQGVAAVIPEGATGEMTVGGQTKSIDLLRGEGALRPASGGASQYTLPEGGSMRVKHRDFTFIVRDVRAGKLVAGASKVDLRPFAYVAGAAFFASLVLVMFYFAPPQPRGLSSDLLNTDSRLIQYLMDVNALEEQKPEWMGAGESGGGEGTKHDGEEGQMGDETADKTDKKYGIKGPEDNKDPVMAKEAAEAEAKTAGVLGVLPGLVGSVNAPTSPYGADYALGNDPMNALGAMTGSDIGQNFGYGGLGLRGTGRGGGGTGQGTIGMGNYGTIGRGGGRGAGEGGYGRGAGGFKGRSAGVPQVRSGAVSTYGSLSKEVIRRVVRRHINEIKFCYEQQLNARPDLAGRVSTKFIISPTGSVQAATVTASELRNTQVESCMTQAIRRWTFPAPDGGGVVVVNYPFMLNAAGGQ